MKVNSIKTYIPSYNRSFKSNKIEYSEKEKPTFSFVAASTTIIGFLLAHDNIAEYIKNGTKTLDKFARGLLVSGIFLLSIDLICKMFDKKE